MKNTGSPNSKEMTIKFTPIDEFLDNMFSLFDISATKLHGIKKGFYDGDHLVGLHNRKINIGGCGAHFISTQDVLSAFEKYTTKLGLEMDVTDTGIDSTIDSMEKVFSKTESMILFGTLESR